jgi:hypothetical protein
MYFFLGFIILSSCAHHRDVRVGSEGIHKIVVRAETKEQGERDAIEQSNHYCDEKNKEASVIEEQGKYTGDMNEEDYKTMKKASKAAEIVGGAAHVFGGKKESTAGGIIGLGGVVADEVAGKGYTVEMKFKCI